MLGFVAYFIAIADHKIRIWMKKFEIIQRVVFQIAFGLMILFIWYIVQEPKEIVNNSPVNSLDDPGIQLFVNFISWLSLSAGLGLLIVGFAGIIRLMFFK